MSRCVHSVMQVVDGNLNEKEHTIITDVWNNIQNERIITYCMNEVNGKSYIIIVENTGTTKKFTKLLSEMFDERKILLNSPLKKPYYDDDAVYNED